MNKFAWIDADSLCYICSTDTLEKSIKNIDSFINKILREVKAEEAVFFLSEGKYFRHEIYPQYKGNRSTSALLFLKELKQHLKLKYKAFTFDGVEADDLVCFFKNKYEDSSIICCMDKDVYSQMPGTHYNYRTGEYITTTKEEGENFTWLQTLMGKLLPKPLKFGEI